MYIGIMYDCACLCVFQDYDPSHPNWEFLKMITEFRSQLQIVPLSLDEEVEEHRICVCVRKRPINARGKERSAEESEDLTHKHTHTHTHHTSMYCGEEYLKSEQ